MDLIRFFWDAVIELNPAATAMDEGVRFPICHPQPLADLFTSAGLGNVEVTAIEILTPFADFDDYWRPFLGGQGPRRRSRWRSTRLSGHGFVIV